MKKLNYSFKHLIIYLSVAFLAFTVTYYEILDTSKIRNIFSKADQYQPNYSKQHITEYAFIYVGSSKCTYSNDEQIYGAIMQIKNELSNRAKKEKIGFHTVGIASELNAESGIEHLRNFGNFNEKIVGAGWNNVGVNRFVYRYSQDYATPSIIILKRTYTDKSFSQIKTEELLYATSGKIRIINWLNNGVKLPKHVKDE